MKICPNCNLPKGRTSQIRSSTERLLLSWLRVRPFRCHYCDHRFYRFSLKNGGTEPVKSVRPLTPGDKAEFERLIGEIRTFEERLMDSPAETPQDESEDKKAYLTRT